MIREINHEFNIKLKYKKNLYDLNKTIGDLFNIDD